MRRFLFWLAAGAALCADQVLLDTGFRIRVDRHERSGELVRLHTGTGVIELPARVVVLIEPEEPVPPLASPTPSPVPVVAEAQPASATQGPKEMVSRAAERYGLPPEFLHSVARVESAYDPRAVSPKGAVGVMQLMPATAALLEADPHDVEQNIDAGARHLRDLLLRYNGSSHRALSAYNAGAGAVERHGGVPPYPETQLYVDKVLRTYQRLAKELPRSSQLANGAHVQ